MKLFPHLRIQPIFVILLLIALLVACKAKKTSVGDGGNGSNNQITDTDQDGIPDNLDKCPTEFGYAEFEGCLPLDSDNDGIPDDEDMCPDKFGSYKYYGCPPDFELEKIGTGSNDKNPVTATDGSSGNENPVETENSGVQNAQKPFVSVVYSYKNKTLVNSEMIVKMMAQINIPEAQLKNNLKLSNRHAQESVKFVGDTLCYKTFTFTGAKKLEVEIEYNPNFFDVSAGHASLQILNSNQPCIWKWKLFAKKETLETSVTIKYRIFSELNDTIGNEEFDIPIAIEILPELKPAEAEKDNAPTEDKGTKYGEQKDKNGNGFLIIIISSSAILALASGLYFFYYKRKKSLLKIYVSYSRKSHQDLIESLYKCLKSEGINILMDKKDLNYQSRISNFMKSLANSNLIIIGLSDNYFKSKFCMFELFEIYLNCGMDLEKFASKIYPIRLEEIDLHNKQVVQNYIDYWEAEEKKWELHFEKNADNISPDQVNEYQFIKRLVNELSNMLHCLSDINSINQKEVQENDFELIKAFIEERFRR